MIKTQRRILQQWRSLAYWARLDMQTQIIVPPVTTWALHNYIYSEDTSTNGAKYSWFTSAQNKRPETTSDMEHSLLYSTQQRETQHNPQLQENAVTVVYPSLCSSLSKYMGDMISVKTWEIQIWARQILELIPDDPKCQTTSPYTLGGSIGLVAALYAEGCSVDSLQRLHRFILCTRRSRGTAYEGGR